MNPQGDRLPIPYRFLHHRVVPRPWPQKAPRRRLPSVCRGRVSEELQVRALCQWGLRWAGASGTRPLSQQLCWSRAVLPLPRLHCPREPAHQHISSFTYHPQLGGSISFWGDFPCLSSVSHHIYCTYHFSLSSLYSLKYILQLKALCKLKSPLQNQN